MLGLLLGIIFSGSVQHESLFPTADISTAQVESRPSWAKIDHRSNTYADMALLYRHDSANVVGFREVETVLRLELTRWPMPGYDPDFAGYGVGHLHVGFGFDWGHVTIGDLYGQFGSGLILRLYTERSLGLDNALRGAKIDLRPYRGIHMTVLGGKQRRYWNMYDDGAWGFNYRQDAALGADVELHLAQWSPRMQQAEAALLVGGSYVAKYQRDEVLPNWSHAGDVRTRLEMKGWNALVEYAYKSADPCLDNGYADTPGQALLMSLGYERPGLSIEARAMRSENMHFRSDRSLTSPTVGCLNHLPSLAYRHTYALATVYPYLMQRGGEWSMEGEVRYTFGHSARRGRRYGPTLRVHATHVRGLGDTWLSSSRAYYTDIHAEVSARLTSRWRLNTMWMYQTCDGSLYEARGGTWRNGIGAVDVRFDVSHRIWMRGELQYLYSRDGGGQRIFALYELSLAFPRDHNLVLMAQEHHVIGRGSTTREDGENYYSARATWNHESHHLSLGYTKNREGYLAVDGVGRLVPAYQGIHITYNYSF